MMHTNVLIFLQTETGIGGFLDINKYKRPDRIDTGEIGKIGNVRIFVSPFIKTYSSNITVYPTLFIGKQAYGGSQLQSMQMIMKPLGSSGVADPLNQRMSVGAKTFFASKILQQDSIQVLESAGIDS
jgi:N4-gp56 family major capsid protein